MVLFKCTIFSVNNKPIKQIIKKYNLICTSHDSQHFVQPIKSANIQ